MQTCLQGFTGVSSSVTKTRGYLQSRSCLVTARPPILEEDHGGPEPLAPVPSNARTPKPELSEPSR